MAKPSSLAQDFVAGIDPFGVYTSEYGRRAEEAGLSRSEHAAKKLVGTAGGFIGGAAVVPSGVSGLVEGIREAGKGGDLKTRAARGLAGFVAGAKKPFQLLGSARSVKKAVERAKAGDTTLTKAELEAIKDLMKKTQVGSLLPSGKGGVLRGIPGAVRDARSLKKLLRSGVLTQSLAKKMDAPVTSGYRTGLASLGLGGAVGAGGASVQYAKGRQSEKKFQQRIGKAQMAKLSSVESAAFWSAYDLEVEKISSAAKVKEVAEGAARSAGRGARSLKDLIDSLTSAPGKAKGKLYEEYLKGYRGDDRGLLEMLRKKSKDPKARMYMLPLVAGAGSAGGVMLGKGLRKNEGSAAYEQPSARSYGEY